MDKIIKLGIVGLGTMAKQLADAVVKGEGMELYAVCTRNTEKLSNFASEWGVPKTFTNYDDMLADEELDGVLIVTPNYLHAQMTISALNAGKHVFCEKPPATNAKDALAMTETAKKTGRLLVYGWPFRFSAKHAFIRDLRDQGMFGDFYYGKAGIVCRCNDPGGWFGVSEYSGGGPLIDRGSHIIDIAMLTMGDFEPVSVFARTFNRVENLDNIKCIDGYRSDSQDCSVKDVEEMASVMINSVNGACLIIEISNSSHIKEDSLYMSYLGSKGGVEIDPEISIHTSMYDYLFNIQPVINCGQFDWGQGVLDEVQHFADCIRGKSDCIISHEDGYKLMRVIEAAFRSAKSGQVEFL